MSLRTRLLLAAGAVALIALVIADAVTYQELRSFLYGKIDQSLEQSHRPIEIALHSGPSPQGAGREAPAPVGAGNGIAGSGTTSSTSTPSVSEGSSGTESCSGFGGLSDPVLRQLAPSTFVELRSATGAALCTYSAPPELGSAESVSESTPKLPARVTGYAKNASDLGEPTVYFTAAAAKGGDSQFRMRASVLESGPYVGGELLVGVPLDSTVGTLDRLLVVELAVTGAALAGALLLGWWLVRVGLRPLRAVEGTAAAIARGELAERVPGEEARTEVGRLARSLNVMLGRIEKAFAQRDATERELRESEGRMRQFVADASHELRTPLTAVSAYAELFEQGAVTRADDLERVMQGIRSETARMGHLVEDLLLLARLDEGRPLEQEEVELVGVAAQAVQTAATVGPQWPVQLVAREPVEVAGDHLRLRQVLDNLLANVRTHCPAGTSTVVAVSSEPGNALITVSDDGPGLDPELAARIFERFYRADPSRSRRHGGAGLGLSIVASIVKAHGGTVATAPRPGGGSVFTIRLPLAGDGDGDGDGDESGDGANADGPISSGDSQPTHS
ncbi:MAG TPA: HAMP domain-containing sensor histidine kinase [Acidimicrobiales bacterium]|nr:HAMP domain-containing sensor histidine kinase [Acidimicrobiales bacterium]